MLFYKNTSELVILFTDFFHKANYINKHLSDHAILLRGLPGYALGIMGVSTQIMPYET